MRRLNVIVILCRNIAFPTRENSCLIRATKFLVSFVFVSFALLESGSSVSFAPSETNILRTSGKTREHEKDCLNRMRNIDRFTPKC